MQGFENAVLLSCAPWCSLMHSLVTGHFHFQKRLCQRENFSHMGLCSWKSISVPSIVKKAAGFTAPHWQEETDACPQSLEGGPFTLFFHPYLGPRRPELYSCLTPQWQWKDPSSLLSVQTHRFGQDRFQSASTKADGLHWSVSKVQQHLPEQHISEARKLPVLPAALAADEPWPCPLSLHTHSPLHYPPTTPPQPVLHWFHMSDRASLAILTPPPKRQCKDT